MALFAACLLTSAAPALATSPQMGLIVEKNLETNRLTLHTGVVLQVTNATRLLSKAGTRITLGSLKVTEASDGVVVADPDAMVRYEGRIRRGVVDATMIRIVGLILQ
jgi:hypothetical protein